MFLSIIIHLLYQLLPSNTCELNYICLLITFVALSGLRKIWFFSPSVHYLHFQFLMQMQIENIRNATTRRNYHRIFFVLAATYINEWIPSQSHIIDNRPLIKRKFDNLEARYENSKSQSVSSSLKSKETAIAANPSSYFYFCRAGRGTSLVWGR